MTLLPGDLIMTGTHAGVGPIKAGNTIEVEIDIGILRNDVVTALPAQSRAQPYWKRRSPLPL